MATLHTRLVLLATVLVSLAHAQSVPPFAGPFVYSPGPTFFGFKAQVVDLDADGRQDLALVPNGFSYSFRYRLSNPNGSFGSLYELPPIFTPMACVDVGDGSPEFVAFASAPCPAPCIGGYSNAGRVCGQAQPLSVSPLSIPMPCSGPTRSGRNMGSRGPTIAVIFADTATNALSSIQSFTLTQVSAGSFTMVPLSQPYMLTAVAPGSSGALIKPCDLDGDGIPDMVALTAVPLGGSVLEIVRQTPAGPVLNGPTPTIVTPGLAGFYLVDLNQDGRDELILDEPSAVSRITPYLNQGQVPGFGGVLLMPSTPLIGWDVGDFGDIDGDGDIDLIAIGNAPSGIGLFLNDGSGSLSFAGSVGGSVYPSISVGDLDADGDLDVVVGGSSVLAYLSQATPSAVTRPGTTDGLGFGSAVTPPGTPPTSYSSAPFFDFKVARGLVGVALDLMAPAFAGAPAYLVGEIAPTGCAPPGMLSPIYVSGGPTTTVMGPYTLPGDGHLVLSIPTQLAPNLSAIVQFVTFGSQAANGAWAATEAHEFQF